MDIVKQLRSVREAESRIPAITNLSNEAKRRFVEIYNSLMDENPNMSEGATIAIAISRARRSNSSDMEKAFDNQSRITVMKNTLSDRINRLDLAIRSQLNQGGVYYSYGDSDSMFVYVTEMGDGELYSFPYVMDGNEFIIDGTMGTRVVPESLFLPAQPDGDDRNNLRKSFSETLTNAILSVCDHFGGSEQEHTSTSEVTKAFDDEERMALFVALSPDEYDLHNDTYSTSEIEKACNDFNTHCMVANLFHMVETEKAEIVQSFINLTPLKLDDGREIKKGAWLQWWHFPKGDPVSDMLWKGVKSGKYNGISVQCRADVEDVEDE